MSDIKIIVWFFVVFSFQLAAKTGYPVPTPDSSDSTNEADSMTEKLRLCLFTLLAIAWFLALPYAAVAQDQDQQVAKAILPLASRA